MRDREAIVLSEAVGVMSAYDVMIEEPASAPVVANLASDNYGGLKFRKGKEIVGQLAHFQNVEVANNALSQISRLMSRQKRLRNDDAENRSHWQRRQGTA